MYIVKAHGGDGPREWFPGPAEPNWDCHNQGYGQLHPVRLVKGRVFP